MYDCLRRPRRRLPAFPWVFLFRSRCKSRANLSQSSPWRSQHILREAFQSAEMMCPRVYNYGPKRAWDFVFRLTTPRLKQRGYVTGELEHGSGKVTWPPTSFMWLALMTPLSLPLSPSCVFLAISGSVEGREGAHRQDGERKDQYKLYARFVCDTELFLLLKVSNRILILRSIGKLIKCIVDTISV